MAVNLNHNWVLGGFRNAFVQSYYEILLMIVRIRIFGIIEAVGLSTVLYGITQLF